MIFKIIISSLSKILFIHPNCESFLDDIISSVLMQSLV